MENLEVFFGDFYGVEVRKLRWILNIVEIKQDEGVKIEIQIIIVQQGLWQ